VLDVDRPCSGGCSREARAIAADEEAKPLCAIAISKAGAAPEPRSPAGCCGGHHYSAGAGSGRWYWRPKPIAHRHKLKCRLTSEGSASSARAELAASRPIASPAHPLPGPTLMKNSPACVRNRLSRRRLAYFRRIPRHAGRRAEAAVRTPHG